MNSCEYVGFIISGNCNFAIALHICVTIAVCAAVAVYDNSVYGKNGNAIGKITMLTIVAMTISGSPDLT